MTMQNELAWYALRTLPMREQMIKKHLINRGHKAFTKTERKFGRWTNGKRKERDAVAAPGYVFIGTSGNPWMEVHRCHMIRSVVSLEGRPARLNPEKLGAFLDLPDESLPDYFRFFRGSPFEIGDMVRIDAPAFEGFELRVRDIQKHEAIFSLVMMGKDTEVRFPVAQCYKSEAA